MLISAMGVAAQEKNNPRNWSTYNRTYGGDRFSPLTIINKSNVSKMKLISTYDLGADQATMQTGPLVIDGVMYFTTESSTYAINAVTGKQRWKHERNVENTGGMGNNRGAAYYNGKIIRGGNDGHVFALNAKNGKLLWDVEMDVAETMPGISVPMAPIVWENLVFIGHAGGDLVGVTGNIYAFNANTGKQEWKFEVVPSDGPIRDEWNEKESGLPATGGCTWSSFSIDTQTGVLYIPTGNPAPDYDTSLRPGRNLYTNSIIALDAKTGKMLAYNQIIKNDFHDWDASSSPVVINTKGGRKLIAAAAKNGLLNILDRSNVRNAADNLTDNFPLVYARATTTRENTDVPLSRETFTHFKPGILGGSLWNGASYDPNADAIYIGANDWGVSVKLFDLDKAGDNTPAAGSAWFGGETKFDDFSEARGWIHAFNVEDGSVKWKVQTSSPVIAGVTPTASGLIFTALLRGEVYALDSDNGKILWEGKTDLYNGGGVITYSVKNKQYVAVVAGVKSGAYTSPSPDSKILIFGL